jgi:enterochelin esterase family protein
MNVKATLKYLSTASLLTAATVQSQPSQAVSPLRAIGERFSDFLARIQTEADSATRSAQIKAFVERLNQYGKPYIEADTIHFLYQGKGRRIGIPSDLNGWNPTIDTMTRIPGTNLFHLAKVVDEAARFEYKLAVDSTWILDPLNRQQAIGGYGPNSEIWMPTYSPPREIEYRSDISHGTVDTFAMKSKLLKRTHPVFVYTPPGYRNSKQLYPSIYVTDGGEYITLALMLNVLDNLIAERRIRPIIAIFIDPRTDIRDSRTSKRMLDYSMSDTFVNFMITEVRAKMVRQYRLDIDPTRTAIMGASLGGLIATYAAYTRPDVFGLCAAQSPAYQWKNRGMIQMISDGQKKPIKIYLDTGTIRDAQDEARRMKAILEEKDYPLHYAEYPEAHNWVNWRARIDDILTYFWGTQ